MVTLVERKQKRSLKIKKELEEAKKQIKKLEKIAKIKPSEVVKVSLTLHSRYIRVNLIKCLYNRKQVVDQTNLHKRRNVTKGRGFR